MVSSERAIHTRSNTMIVRKIEKQQEAQQVKRGRGRPKGSTNAAKTQNMFTWKCVCGEKMDTEVKALFVRCKCGKQMSCNKTAGQIK
jgi:hypothetical protein